MNALRIFAIPLIGLLLLAAVVLIFLRDGGSPRIAGPSALRIWADEALRLPLESPDMEHEQGLLGRFERRTGIPSRVTYGTLAQWERDPQSRRETDLVLTSCAQWIDKLEAEGLLAERTPFARQAAGDSLVEVETPVLYALHLATSPRGDETAQLTRFLAGPAARDLLQAYGLATHEVKP